MGTPGNVAEHGRVLARTFRALAVTRAGQRGARRRFSSIVAPPPPPLLTAKNGAEMSQDGTSKKLTDAQQRQYVAEGVNDNH